MVVDRGRVGKETVERHERRDGRKKREEAEIGHARRDREDAILVHLFVGAPGDVLPALGGNFGRRAGDAAAVLFGRCLALHFRAGMGLGVPRLGSLVAGGSSAVPRLGAAARALQD
jgi:hypothetical protein